MAIKYLNLFVCLFNFNEMNTDLFLFYLLSRLIFLLLLTDYFLQQVTEISLVGTGINFFIGLNGKTSEQWINQQSVRAIMGNTLFCSNYPPYPKNALTSWSVDKETRYELRVQLGKEIPKISFSILMIDCHTFPLI